MTDLDRKRVVRAFLAFACIAGAASAWANPVTQEYHCSPALPKGDTLAVDFNSGGKSITVQFPDGKSVRLPQQVSGSGFRYGRGKLEVFGKGETEISLLLPGEPVRQCVTQAR